MYRAPSYFLSMLLLTSISSTAQNNILNNSGFETGMMCYTNWMWSYTGQDFAGDYQFSLSNDAHSGNYSFQISCNGSDCDKAAAISDYIPASPNQSFQMSLWAKCPAGTTATIYVPWTPAGGSSQYLTCDGNWDQNEFSFQTGPSAGTLYYYLFLYGTQYVRFDDLVLTYGDGTAPAHNPLHAGTRNTSVSGQTVYVDGAPYLSLGFYQVPYSDLAQVAATGAKTIVGINYNSADCFNISQEAYLDTAYDLGLNFLTDSSTTARQNVPSVFTGATQSFAPHLANIGWVLADEPDLVEVPWFYVPAANFIAEYQAAKLGTTLPIAADFQHAAYDTVSYLAPYNGSVDIWMAEPYGTDFSTLSHATQLFNAIQPRPIWLAQDDIDAGLIVPKAYWAIVNGATGIHYFNWPTIQTEPDKLAAMEQVFTELKALNNAIFGQPLDALVTAPAGIGAMSRFDSSTGNAYIVSVNPVASTVQGNFLVQGLTAGQQIAVLDENRSITANSGQFTDTFAGISRHVYQIQASQTGLTGSIVSQSGAITSRDWSIQVYDTGLGAAHAAQITSLTFTQTGGAACTPAVTPGTFPINLGDISPSQSATGNIMIDFAGCGSTAKWTVDVGLSANYGATTATFSRNNERM